MSFYTDVQWQAYAAEQQRKLDKQYARRQTELLDYMHQKIWHGVFQGHPARRNTALHAAQIAMGCLDYEPKKDCGRFRSISRMQEIEGYSSDVCGECLVHRDRHSGVKS